MPTTTWVNHAGEYPAVKTSRDLLRETLDRWENTVARIADGSTLRAWSGLRSICRSCPRGMNFGPLWARVVHRRIRRSGLVDSDVSATWARVYALVPAAISEIRKEKYGQK